MPLRKNNSRIPDTNFAGKEPTQFGRAIVLDSKANRLQAGYRPVEIGWVKLEPEFCEVAQVYTLNNPQIPIEPGAQRTHGIASQKVSGQPTVTKLLVTFHPEKFRGERVVVVAHNALCDVPMFEPF